jgi:hypothetical protein
MFLIEIAWRCDRHAWQATHFDESLGGTRSDYQVERILREAVRDQ